MKEFEQKFKLQDDVMQSLRQEANKAVTAAQQAQRADQNLRDQVANLKQQLQQQTNRIPDSKTPRIIEELNDKLQQSQEVVKKLTADNERLNRKTQDYASTNNALEGELKDTQKQMSDLSAENERLIKMQQLKQQEILALQRSINDMEAKVQPDNKEELATLKKQKESLKQQLENSNQEIKRLSDSLEEIKLQYGVLSNRNNLHLSHIEQLKEEVKNYEEGIISLFTTNQQLTDQITELKRLNEELNARHERDRAEINSMINPIAEEKQAVEEKQPAEDQQGQNESPPVNNSDINKMKYVIAKTIARLNGRTVDEEIANINSQQYSIDDIKNMFVKMLISVNIKKDGDVGYIVNKYIKPNVENMAILLENKGVEKKELDKVIALYNTGDAQSNKDFRELTENGFVSNIIARYRDALNSVPQNVVGGGGFESLSKLRPSWLLILAAALIYSIIVLIAKLVNYDDKIKYENHNSIYYNSDHNNQNYNNQDYQNYNQQIDDLTYTNYTPYPAQQYASDQINYDTSNPDQTYLSNNPVIDTYANVVSFT